MKKHKALLAVILGISCLCGCSNLLGDFGRIDEVPEPDFRIVDYSKVKEGYYLSDSGDGSYYLIKDGKLTHANFDWEKYYRETYPRGDETVSEYEESVREYVEFYTNDKINKPFTPVEYDSLDIYVKLVTNPSPEDIASNGFDGGATGPHMRDENTIGTEPPYYIYCGTSLPESVQTQTPD